MTELVPIGVFRQARAGSIGASDVPDIVRRTKSGWSATRANLMALKTLERLTGVAVETYQSKAMADGLERQPLATAAYAFIYDVEVEQPPAPGLIPHPLIDGTHASPDGLVGAHGLVEVKCPQLAAHLDTLLTEKVERDYRVQIQWQFACTGRHWCDYVSWNPDFPPAMQLFVQRIERDPDLISELETDVLMFLAELETKVAQLKRRYDWQEAA
jgi:predicted phage-related endonuclease